MEITHKQTDTLTPYARNSRTHSKAQVAKLADSIREFGFTNPVLIDGDGGLIAGHGRVLAARKLGLESVPCISLAHLSEAQRRAYVIADNKLAEIGSGWDKETLGLELADLRGLDFDLGLIGFDGAVEIAPVDIESGSVDLPADLIDDPDEPIECPHCKRFFIP